MSESEHTFRSHDGTELFYRAFRPESTARGTVVVLHRGHEHSGRMEELARELAADFDVFAWDQRGHGRSPGERGWAQDLSVIVRDVEAFVRTLEREHGVRASETAILGYSVGGVVAASWVHDYAPEVRALVLVAPAFKIKLYIPLARPLLRLGGALLGRLYVKSYVKSRWVTHDPEQRRRYDADPEIFRQIAANILLDLYDTSERLIEDAGAIVAPALVLSAGSDFVVDVRDQKAFFDRLSSVTREWHLLRGFYHAVLHEAGRREAFDTIRRFLERRFAEPPRVPSLLDAHRAGYTQREHDVLVNPLPPLSLRRLLFACQKVGLHTGGRLSEGIRLGLATGFDSGVTLDYVYRNRASGWLGVGKLIDRAYLDAVGWRGIRQRRAHIEGLLSRALEELAASGRPIRVLDVACGGGRYLLATLKRYAHLAPVALLRDWSEASLEKGRAIAEELGLSGITFEKGDAFDREALGAISPAPTVTIVSGLYELFPDNDRVLTSLRGIADAMREGGHLLYTGQPWHPQLEYIARVLPNREGVPWVMRRRTQAEMDQLVEAAGFEKVAQEVDRWGIFTVSLAKKKDGAEGFGEPDHQRRRRPGSPRS